MALKDKKLKLWYASLMLFIPFIWVLMGHFGYLAGVENIGLDWRYRLRGDIESPVKLIYVDLDSKAIELMGERPFPRVFYAETVDSLFQNGHVKSVGIDIVFSDSAHSFLTDPQKISLDNEAFRRVILKYPNLILAAAYTPRVNHLSEDENIRFTEFPLIYRGHKDRLSNALPEQPSVGLIGFSDGNLGIINVDEYLSQDSNTNWIPMFAHTPGPTYYTMALQLMAAYYGVHEENVEIKENSILLKSAKGELIKEIPLELNQLVEVNWFSRFFSESNDRYSMADILLATAWLHEGSEEQQSQATLLFEDFKDAIVLIGPVDPMLQDLSPTPFDSEPVPRVGIHGNLLKTLFSEFYINRLPSALNYLLVFCISIIVFLLAIYSGKKSGLLKVASLCFLGGYIACVFIAFSWFHWIIPLVTPIGAAISASFLGVIIKLLYEEKQKSRIKNMFGTYVSPALVSQMVESQEEPQLGGAQENITAFFSDIESFSSFSEVLSPSQLVDLMNEYLTEMTDIIQLGQGTLDKYIGDAIVAMFGAPVHLENHAASACLVANQVQQKQKELRKKWRNELNKWPELVHCMNTRIGLNTGPAIVGNMGSATRFNYTMMGDTVNLAARCESGAKAYGVYTMVAEDTMREAMTQESQLAFRYLDRIIVKGRTEPVSMYEVVGLNTEISDAIKQSIDIYDAAIKEYLSQDWDRAIELFKQSSVLEQFKPGEYPGATTNPSLVMIERCNLLKSTPPGSDWNGVFTMQSK